MPWRVNPAEKDGFDGVIMRAGGERLSYRYQYAMGMVTLSGPLDLGAASFEVLEILSCGKDCLQVGGNRWYFTREACEGDRIKGVR